MLIRLATPDHYKLHPFSFAIPVLVVLSPIMLVEAAIGLCPRRLPSSTNAAKDITLAKALSGSYAMHVGLIWWSVGMVLALGYFCVSYGMFRGKVSRQADGYGH